MVNRRNNHVAERISFITQKEVLEAHNGKIVLGIMV
jgi:hypothetical protein